MKRRWIANAVMAGVIVLILLGGVLAAGGILGWFDRAGDGAIAERPRGIVHIQRDGLAFSLEADTVLRTGDRLETAAAAAAVLRIGESTLTVDQSTSLEILSADAAHFSARVDKGQVFAVSEGAPLTLAFEGQTVTLSKGAYSLSVRSGAQDLSVYAGSVRLEQALAQAGQRLSWVGADVTVVPCEAGSLNDFCMEQIRSANREMALCFTDADLDEVLAKRAAELEALLQVRPTEPAPPPTEPSTQAPTQPAAQPTPPPETQAAPTVPPETLPPETQPPETQPPQPSETEVSPELTCSLVIQCNTILDHWDLLDPAKAGYVPDSGTILSTSIAFAPGETAFDVLKRACDAAGIPLEYSWTPIYDSYYIEGINNLYEFDCGPESGWIYQVNGWSPNYGCSAYALSDGDVIAFRYTCVGLGADLG